MAVHSLTLNLPGSLNEMQVLATLMKRYEQTMLVRAQATLLLKQRGHDVSEMVAVS
jgi:hypothetical protein